jgi:spermidine synthase
MGVKGAMILLALPFLVLLFFTFKTWTAEPLQRGICIASAVALMLLSLTWSKTSEEREILPDSVVKRDHTGTVIGSGKGIEKLLLVNGIGITKLTPITKLMVHWPAAHLPEKPRNILVLCFGMGTSYRSAMRWGVDSTAVELVPSVRDVFGFFHRDADQLLADPSKGRVIIDDARRFLQRTATKFDVITIDPPPPTEAAGSSLLYSKEFYDLIKMRLSENGIVQQWYPKGDLLSGQAAARSLAESFPHVRAWVSVEGWGLHFLASSKPIPKLTVDQLMAKLPEAVQVDIREWSPPNITTRMFVERLVSQEFPMKEVLHPNPDFSITDDRPFNEYFVLRRYFGYPLGDTSGRVIISVGAVVLIIALIVLRPRRKFIPS